MPTARIQAIATRSRTTLLCLPERATQECARETVETDQEITYYARVVQSLRGDIPVEALIQWSWAANKHSAVSSPKTELYSGNYMYYALASSKEVKNCRTRRNLLLRRTVSPAWIPMIWETTSFTSR